MDSTFNILINQIALYIYLIIGLIEIIIINILNIYVLCRRVLIVFLQVHLVYHIVI